MEAIKLQPPTLLSSQHLMTDFDCQVPALNDWLKRRALNNQVSGASRTFVIVDKSQNVIGYYALAAGAVTHSHASTAIRRNMPEPIPVLVLGRLAIDYRFHGKGWGADLLHDAVLRTMRLAEEIGIRALLVHALDDKARQFYLHHGFTSSPINSLTLLLRLSTEKI